MIKGITTIRHVAGTKEFKVLNKLFDALGFERGTPWKTARGQGAPFKVPLGQIEFVEGLEPSMPTFGLRSQIWIRFAMCWQRKMSKHRKSARRRGIHGFWWLNQPRDQKFFSGRRTALARMRLKAS